MNITKYSKLALLLSGLLACTIKGNLGDSSPYSTDTDSGDSSESSSPGTEGGTSTSGSPGTTGGPGPGSDSSVSATTAVPGTDSATTDWAGTTLAPETDTDWAGTTLAPGTDTDWAGTTGDTTDSWETETSTGSGQYTTGEPVEPCEGEAVPIDAEVISYLESQIAANPDSDGTTGDDEDPNQIYVRFSDQTFTCDDPHDRLACGHHWELSLRIPSEFQTPGLYPLSFVDVHAFGVETGPDTGSDDCDGGGGIAKGTLEIIAVDAETVTGRLCHVTWWGLDNGFELDGSFAAPRCPQ